MTSYKTRIRAARKRRGPLILALDYASGPAPAKRAMSAIGRLSGHLCGIKVNMHLLLPLGRAEVRALTGAARRRGLVCIADIKLNDIPATNEAACARLWDMGFDAVIANPVMGPEALGSLARSAARQGRGVISLCHMSAPEAAPAYELALASRPSSLYRLFMRWALAAKVDGVVAGATYPDIVRYCKKAAGGRLEVYSPGVGAQGGDPRAALASGSDYLIVGRSILGARDPESEAARLQALALDR